MDRYDTSPLSLKPCFSGALFLPVGTTGRVLSVSSWSVWDGLVHTLVMVTSPLDVDARYPELLMCAPLNEL